MESRILLPWPFRPIQWLYWGTLAALEAFVKVLGGLALPVFIACWIFLLPFMLVVCGVMGVGIPESFARDRGERTWRDRFAFDQGEGPMDTIGQPPFNPIDAYDNAGHTALMRAVKAADPAAVRELLQQGADPTITEKNFGTSTALNMAQRELSRAQRVPRTQESSLDALNEIIYMLTPRS